VSWIDRLYERLDYPWYLHPLFLLWVILPAGGALALYGLVELIRLL